MKHPTNRAERLKLKKLKDEKAKELSGKVRRQIKTKLEEQETQDELARYKTNRDLAVSGFD